MTSIRKFVYATLLAVAALNVAPTLAAAEEPTHGKFTLAHDVMWGTAKIPAGAYEFSYDPNSLSPVLTLTKIDGVRTGYMVLVAASESSKPTDSNRLLLAGSGESSYVSAMQLPESGTTLIFAAPAHGWKAAEKSATTLASAGN
jgi:hypothetical protein